ncbi:MAG TPA: guanylate kinase [Kofleriaceae bacterium]|nr:guanylate kinase [Kofleriaceae bacterium]
MSERGRLVIISSPSGAGKTTLAHRLIAEFERVEFSVSYTTRPPRVNERLGVDYHFVDDPTFDRMIAGGDFAEWAEVHGNRYGTSREAVELALVGGRDVVFDVDWQGGGALSDKWPGDSVKIFILPPDLATLEARLRRRATDSEEVIQRRLRKAKEELTHYGEYRYLIVNDDLDAAYGVLRAVYLVNRYQDVAARAESTAVVAHARALIEGR